MSDHPLTAYCYGTGDYESFFICIYPRTSARQSALDTSARGGKFNDVSYGAAPFVIAMLIMIGLLLVYPEIALWLPNQFY